MTPSFTLGNRTIGPEAPPLVIAEVGINHGGDFDKAIFLIDRAVEIGCECIKFQSHSVDYEMSPTPDRPELTKIRETIQRCSLTTHQQNVLKDYCEQKGIIFLSTPFSLWAAERLQEINVAGFKIGSGECNNLPLLRLIAQYRKPVLLSTGMNSLESIGPSVAILRRAQCPYALLHCTSIYPTPETAIRLGALQELAQAFPDAVLGLSDHSETIYPCLGAVPLGAAILERHFTGDKSWEGPDIGVSSTPEEFSQLIEGSRRIHASLGGKKTVLEEEKPVMEFAFATVTAAQDILAGSLLTRDNLTVMRPGTGEIPAAKFEEVLGKRTKKALKKNEKIDWETLH